VTGSHLAKAPAGFSVDEAAEVLRTTATAATTRDFRAMQRLHRLLK
jgi:hypothetical protein